MSSEKKEPNRLYYGDCLTVMRDMVPDFSVDLIYLDPPFNSNRDYHTIYKSETGHPLPEQDKAFSDMWDYEFRKKDINQLSEIMRKEKIDENFIYLWEAWVKALTDTQPTMLAYLSYMVPRLLHMRLALKPTGTLYFHCDPNCSHYIKVMLDGIFGKRNFLNEIVWKYGLGGSSKRYFSRKHDTILFYSKSKKYYFDKPLEDATSVRMRGKKKGMLDVWDIPSLNNMAKERIGYPTQKPLELLERIVEASCPPDGVVLDPFCGGGTTMHAAEKLGRRWIGIDIAIHAIKRVTKARLIEQMRLVEGQDFIVDGIPNSVESALELWNRDKYHFQTWCVEQAEGGVSPKRSQDGGVDGRLFFENSETGKYEKMIIQVKGGKSVSVKDARELAGVLLNSDACMAGMIVLDRPELTDAKLSNIEKFMESKGDVTIGGWLYPKVQLLRVSELVKGELFHTPNTRGKKGSLQRYLRKEPSLPES